MSLRREALRIICITTMILNCIVVVTESANAITPISANRLVEANGESFCTGCGPNGEDEFFSDGESIPSTAIGLFDEHAQSLGSDALQDSNVSTAGISGTGSISLGFSDFNDAKSTLLVDFTVATASTVNLSGHVESFGSISDAFVAFSGPGGEVFRVDSFGGNENFDEEFLLQAGTTYTLDVQVVGESGGGGGDGADWSINLSAVPEPSAGVLALFFAFAGMGLRRC